MMGMDESIHGVEELCKVFSFVDTLYKDLRMDRLQQVPLGTFKESNVQQERKISLHRAAQLCPEYAPALAHTFIT
jgi:hypothetical protein